MEFFENLTWGSPVAIFLFVLGIIFIHGLFSLLKSRSLDATIQKLIGSGEDIDTEILKELTGRDRERSSDDGDLVLAGMITMAVGVGLTFMGWQISKTENEEEVFQILLGVASIPFLVGLVLLIVGLSRQKKS